MSDIDKAIEAAVSAIHKALYVVTPDSLQPSAALVTALEERGFGIAPAVSTWQMDRALDEKPTGKGAWGGAFAARPRPSCMEASLDKLQREGQECYDRSTASKRLAELRAKKAGAEHSTEAERTLDGLKQASARQAGHLDDLSRRVTGLEVRLSDIEKSLSAIEARLSGEGR